MKALTLALAACTLATPLLAECPDTPLEPSEPPLVLTRTDPLFQVSLTRNAEGLLTEERIMAGGLDTVTTYAADIWPMDRTDANGMLSLRYNGDPAALDLTEVGATLTLPVALLVGGRAQVAEGIDTKTVQDRTQISVGDCTYDVTVIRNRMALEGMRTGYTLSYYSPLLGVVLGNVVTDADYEPQRAVLFDEIVQGE